MQIYQTGHLKNILIIIIIHLHYWKLNIKLYIKNIRENSKIQTCIKVKVKL